MDKNGEDLAINLSDDSDMKDGFFGSKEEHGCENENDGNGDGENKVQEDMGIEKITQLTRDDIQRLEFESEAEACEFYSMYARCNGFVIRKDDVALDLKGNIVMHQLV